MEVESNGNGHGMKDATIWWIMEGRVDEMEGQSTDDGACDDGGDHHGRDGRGAGGELTRMDLPDRRQEDD